MADSSEEATPRAHRTVASSHQQPQMENLRWRRYKEYGEQLRPVADEDLPSALRNNRKYLLHYGFACELPRCEPGKSLISAVTSADEKLERVRQAIKPASLKKSFTVTGSASLWFNMVLALYSSHDSDVPCYMKDDLKRIQEELCKEFATVGEPMWHWDEQRHGASAHQFKPFNEIYRIHPMDKFRRAE